MQEEFFLGDLPENLKFKNSDKLHKSAKKWTKKDGKSGAKIQILNFIFQFYYSHPFKL